MLSTSSLQNGGKELPGEEWEKQPSRQETSVMALEQERWGHPRN